MRDIAINRIMTTDPITIGPDESVAAAKAMLESHGIHHLPVVERGVLIGILSSSDLLKLHVLRTRAQALDAVKVSQVMEAEPVTLGVFADLVDVASKLSEGGFHSLPVVEADNVLVGIVTSTDLINHLLRQVPRSDGSLHQKEGPEPGNRVTDAALTASTRVAKDAVKVAKDDPMAAALLHLTKQNRLLKEVSKAAELYMRSGHAEHEHSVLIKALADVQRFGSN
jgi:acetoin utilization protein AcuB